MGAKDVNFVMNDPCLQTLYEIVFLLSSGEVRTTLKAGSRFNVTWHLGYPHQGGFKLELLDSNERHVKDLTPVSDDQEFVLGDTT